MGRVGAISTGYEEQGEGYARQEPPYTKANPHWSSLDRGRESNGEENEKEACSTNDLKDRKCQDSGCFIGMKPHVK